MESRRLLLHEELVEVLGSRNVYFQPPTNSALVYPCILYEVDGMSNDYADNKVYLQSVKYKVTVIDKHHNSPIFERLLSRPYTAYSTRFTTTGLNHYICTVYDRK